MIKLDKVTYLYRYLSLQFDLQINTCEKVAILGPSGAGKSTLLNLISGFLTPHSGTVWLNGLIYNKVSPARRPVSILFQENNLFSHLTIEENIGLGLHPGLRLTSTQYKQLQDIAQKIGLVQILDHLPANVSGGQRQRAALARCLLRQQPILLLDEPFSSLDSVLRVEMAKFINEICAKYKLTLLIVSHNFDDILKLTPRTIVIVNGHIHYDGPTTTLANDKSSIVSDILNIS